MAQTIRSLDWSTTSLGELDSWPLNLRSAVNFCLCSQFPAALLWGPQRIQLYNDAYAPFCRNAQPHAVDLDFKCCHALDLPGAEALLKKVDGGTAVKLSDRRIFVKRKGFLEETYFVSHFTPVCDGTGLAIGIFHLMIETTEQVLAERRTRLLREIADHASGCNTVDEVAALLKGTLASEPCDVPFLLLYSCDSERKRMHLVARVGLPRDTVMSPDNVTLTPGSDSRWRLCESLRQRGMVEIDDLQQRFGRYSCGPYEEPPTRALMIPIPYKGNDHSLAIVIAGVSARRPLNEAYRNFYTLLADAISQGLATAEAQKKDQHWRKTCEALKTDITECKRDEQAVKAADRRKDEFLATLAHELRNPLAPLRNGLEIMRLASNDPAAVEKARKMMERQLAHMVRLIDDLLDLNRIRSGKILLHQQAIPLAAAVQQAVETSRPVIDDRLQKLTVSLPAQSPYVNADPVRLAQVFSNLLNNAAKFTDQGGNIWLTVKRRNGELAVSVKDTGIGIPPPLLPRVFDMFTQADPSLERMQGGLGIGLSLVKGLVEMQGGRVEVHSDGLNQGSEFTVWLPEIESCRTEEPDRVQTANLNRRRRVLVVDDNRDSAASMATILELLDNETRVAHSGLEALGIAATYRPHVVLLDIGMPRMNGYEVARKIREQAWGREALLVALTGLGQEEDRRRSHEAGFNHHLVKPVELEAIQKVFDNQAPQ